jgi:GNAT superfamily N-acetyltransferase
MSRMPEPVEFVPGRASRSLWARYHAFRRRAQLERRPDEPAAPDDLVEARLQRHDPFQEHHRFLATEGDEVVGELEVEALRPASPEYETNRHLMWASCHVLEPRRRRGVASRWLPTVLELLDRHGATVLTATAETEAGDAFLRGIGAAPRMTDRGSRLDLREVDWGMVERWVREGQAASPAARLELYPTGEPEELLEELAAAANELLNTMPWEGMDHGDIVVTPETMRESRERREAAGTVNPLCLVRDADGTIAGMTDVVVHGYEPGIVRQYFTGVHPRARGRGLGKWLKAAMLQHVREAYPHAVWLTTENAGSNAPMLGINEALGFRLQRTMTTYQVGRDALSRAIRPG